MGSAYLKVLSDIKCYIYIDNVLKGTASPHIIEKIYLEHGEYWVQLISTENSNFKIEQIVLIQTDRVLQANFSEVYTDVFNDEYFRYSSEEKCYRNTLTGQKITSKLYEDGTPFSNGIAKVKRGNKWGCIDKEGREIVACEYFTPHLNAKESIPCIYHNIHILDNKHIIVNKDYKYGLVDISGDIIIPVEYEDIKQFHEDLFWTKLNGKWGLMDISGTLIIPHKYTNVHGFKVEFNGMWGFIDKAGNEIIPCKYKYIDNRKGNILEAKNLLENVSDYYIFHQEKLIPKTFEYIEPFDDEYATFGLNGKKGIIDTHGNEIFPPTYEKISYADEGLFLIERNGFIGYVDINGNEVIPCNKYRYGGHFYNGYTLVSITGFGWVFINKVGIEVTPWKYSKMGGFSEGLALVIDEHGKIGFINRSFEEVVPCIYDYKEDWYDIYFTNGIVCLQKDNKQGYINKDGKEIIPFEYDEIYDLERDGNYCDTYIKDKRGLIDSNLGKVIIPCKYDSVRRPHEDLIGVKSGEKWGFANTADQIIIPCIYDEVRDFSDGAAAVKLNGKWGHINKQGQNIGNFIFDDTLGFRNGLATVYRGRYPTVINKKGQFILHSTQYPTGRYISDLKLIQVYNANDKIGFVDTDCNEVIPCQYDDLDTMSKNSCLFKVKSNGLYGIVCIGIN